MYRGLPAKLQTHHVDTSRVAVHLIAFLHRIKYASWPVHGDDVDTKFILLGLAPTTPSLVRFFKRKSRQASRGHVLRNYARQPAATLSSSCGDGLLFGSSPCAPMDGSACLVWGSADRPHVGVATKKTFVVRNQISSVGSRADEHSPALLTTSMR